MTSVAGDYSLCGWRVRSEWPLPELLPWRGDERDADVTIRVGEVPERLPGRSSEGPLIQVNDDGWARYLVRNVATYLIRGGNDITIATALPSTTPDVGLFLLGTAFGILCHQRGVLPLHASCVALGDRVIAFAGASGSGKSTVAAALLAQGGLLLSDDVTVIDVNAQGGPTVLPSFPRQKLWQDTLNALSISPGRPLRTTAQLNKFERQVFDKFHAEPARLDAVCHLESSLQEGMRAQPVRGIHAVQLLQHNIYRHRTAKLLGFAARQFADSGTLAARVPNWMLKLGRDLPESIAGLAELPSLLEQA